jgi:hypothetical protein
MKKKNARRIVAVFVIAFAFVMMANIFGMFAMDRAMENDDGDSIEIADGDEWVQVVDHRIDEPCDEFDGVQVVDFRIDYPCDEFDGVQVVDFRIDYPCGSEIGNFHVEHRIDTPF